MDVRDITAENVAKAVGGTVERDGSILCCLPDSRGERHAQSVAAAVDHRHAPHPVSLPLAELRRQAFPGHPRPPGRKVRPAAIACRRHAAMRDKEIPTTTTSTSDGSYAWTKTRYVTQSGKKRFRCEVWDESTEAMVEPAGRRGCRCSSIWQTIASVLAAYPATAPADRRGRKGCRSRREDLALLATTNADGAGKWRVEDTQTLIKLGARKVVVCPDNDAPRHRPRHPRRQDRSNQPASRCAGWSCPSSAPRRIFRTGRPSRRTPTRSSTS